jgi:hypothetical protein
MFRSEVIKITDCAQLSTVDCNKAYMLTRYQNEGVLLQL